MKKKKLPFIVRAAASVAEDVLFYGFLAFTLLILAVCLVITGVDDMDEESPVTK